MIAFENLGNYAQCLEYYQWALQMKKALHAGNHADVALVLQSIGYTHYSLGHLQEAIQNYEQALAIPAVSPAMKASVGHNLGCMYKVTVLAAEQASDKQCAQAYLRKTTTSFE